jgi:hypothetical protein
VYWEPCGLFIHCQDERLCQHLSVTLAAKRSRKVEPQASHMPQLYDVPAYQSRQLLLNDTIFCVQGRMKRPWIVGCSMIHSVISVAGVSSVANVLAPAWNDWYRKSLNRWGSFLAEEHLCGFGLGDVLFNSKFWWLVMILMKVKFKLYFLYDAYDVNMWLFFCQVAPRVAILV